MELEQGEGPSQDTLLRQCVLQEEMECDSPHQEHLTETATGQKTSVKISLGSGLGAKHYLPPRDFSVTIFPLHWELYQLSEQAVTSLSKE